MDFHDGYFKFDFSTHPSFDPLRPLGEVVNRLIEEHLTWGAQVINSLGDKRLDVIVKEVEE